MDAEPLDVSLVVARHASVESQQLALQTGGPARVEAEAPLLAAPDGDLPAHLGPSDAHVAPDPHGPVLVDTQTHFAQPEVECVLPLREPVVERLVQPPLTLLTVQRVL